MKQALCLTLVAVLCAGGAGAATRAKLRPVRFTAVKIQGAFWAPRLRINRQRTVPHNLDTCQSTGRLRNFAQTAGVDKTPFRGHVFHDSDVYKVLEGVAYALATARDPQLEARLDRIIGTIAKSQQPDGYLNTYFTKKAPKKRWSNLGSAHELYCAGHLFEAAVAHYEATGKRTFLDVATKYADYIASVFGEGEGKRHGVAGHEEIELALVKLWRATGNERYRKLAQYSVDARGDAPRRKLFGRYCQDHKPIREQSEPAGHCVRAMYLYSAVADLAAVTGDQGYIAALERLWQNVVHRRMYITGGVGVQRHGEGFAADYVLPNYDAYAETCAALGMVFWNHRLALLHGEGRFADIVERGIYNGALSGVSLDGVKFFYVNPLASRGNHHRQAWYGCACCPTNVVRFLAALGDYVYAASADGEAAYVLQYIAGSGAIPLKGGRVTLVQKTGYPWDGSVQVIVEPEGASDFAVALRIPGWCQGFTVKVNGERLRRRPARGFITIRRAWSSGDIIELDLPMPIRQVAAAPQVENNVGRLALMRGPVVYCLEDADHGVPVDRIALPRGAKLEAKFEPSLLGGVTVIEGMGQGAGRPETMEELKSPKPRPVKVRAIPYYAWDNRTPGRMVVWIPEKPPGLPALKSATVALLGRPSASHCHRADAATALNDGVLPTSSIAHSIPRFTWWDHRGTTEWAQLDFKKPQRLSKAEVYWFDDTGRGACRVPQSWRLLYRDRGAWKPVEGASACGVERDKFNVVTFAPVTTAAIRIEVQLRPNVSGGILEWRLPE